MLRFTSILALLLVWSPAALAGGGNEFDLSIHGFYVVDFVAYLALMGFLFKKPARQFLEDRHAKAKAEMEEATGIKAEAEERVQRYEDLLANLDSEIVTLRDDFKSDGERESQRIDEAASAAADKLRHEGARVLSRQQAQGVDDLQQDLASKALTRAEAIVAERLDDKTQQALIRSFIDDLEQRTSLDTTAS